MLFCLNQTCATCVNPQYYPDNGTCCQCPDHCKDGECVSELQCTHGCEDGYYGLNCSETCSQLDSKCERCENSANGSETVSCTQCVDGYFTDSDGLCNGCHPNCLNNSCDQFTRHCSSGCVEGFWGNTCDISCLDGCSVCKNNDGGCLVCTNGSNYGYNCKLTCNERCNNSQCHIETGHCVDGCVDSYYGTMCEYECPIYCKNNQCHVETGHCVDGCIGNHYGRMCESKCSTNCGSSGEESRCSPVTGKCLNECVDGFYGDYCSIPCSDLCNRGLCHSSNGTCIYGCVDGFEVRNQTCDTTRGTYIYG